MASKLAISLFFSFRRAVFRVALVALLSAALAGCPASRGGRDVQKSTTRLDLAKDFLRKGQLDAAETEANKALALHKGNAEAHYVLGLIDLFRAQLTQRLLEVDECLSGAEAEALRADKDEHLLAAERHFIQANEIAPDLGESWASRGTVATLLGRHEDAIAHLQRALAVPDKLENIALVRANLGWAYFHKNDLVSATKSLLQAAQFQPGMCVATYRLGRVYFARKEWENALEKFRDVAGPLKCPIQDAHLFMMKTYVEMGVLDELPKVEEACVALAPRSCIADQCKALAASVAPPASPASDDP